MITTTASRPPDRNLPVISTGRALRVGPCMEHCLRLLEHRPFATQWELSLATGPHGSNAYGYQIVRRCVDRGLIAFDAATANGRTLGRPILTDHGREVLERLRAARVTP